MFEMFKKPIPFKILMYLVLSFIGTSAFIYDGGTLLEAFYIYLGFYLLPATIPIGYHRWLTHKHFEPYRPVRYFLLWCMVATGASTPANFVYAHRVHHKFSDDLKKDPHHNKLGLIKLFFGDFTIADERVPMLDVYRQKDVLFVEKNYGKLQILNFIILWLINPHIAMLSFLFANVRCIFHATLANFITHNGFRENRPTNIYTWWQFVNWEKLHKNHHDAPGYPNYEKDTKDFDIGYHVFKYLGKVNWPNRAKTS